MSKYVHRPQNRSEWLKALQDLPANPSKIPAFFFGHGSPFLVRKEEPPSDTNPMEAFITYGGPKGPLAQFLRDFGPALLRKYNPKGIVVFSAHWETSNTRLISDYHGENPLLMDYFGFPPYFYELKFKSVGDPKLSQRVLELLQENNRPARIIGQDEPRGHDGRGFKGTGLDHGVFIPFRLMFGEEFTDIPIVQVSIDASYTHTARENWILGKSVAKLREEGILILSGGYGIHNLQDFSSFAPQTASRMCKAFDQAIHDAVNIPDDEERKDVMSNLLHHRGFHESNPTAEHFVPLYVAAGAGEGEGEIRTLYGGYGAPTFAFGVTA